MISKIKIKNVGPIEKEITIDFTYFGYHVDSNKNNDSYIDYERQVNSKNRLSFVKGIVGRNATGKSSIVTMLNIVNKIIDNIEQKLLESKEFDVAQLINDQISLEEKSCIEIEQEDKSWIKIETIENDKKLKDIKVSQNGLRPFMLSEYIKQIQKETFDSSVESNINELRRHIKERLSIIAKVKTIETSNFESRVQELIKLIGKSSIVETLIALDSNIVQLEQKDNKLYATTRSNNSISVDKLSKGVQHSLLLISELKINAKSSNPCLFVIDDAHSNIDYKVLENTVLALVSQKTNKCLSQILFTTNNIELVANKVVDQKNFVVLSNDENGYIGAQTLFDMLLKHSVTGRVAVHPNRGRVSYMDHYYDDNDKTVYKEGFVNPFFIGENGVAKLFNANDNKRKSVGVNPVRTIPAEKVRKADFKVS